MDVLNQEKLSANAYRVLGLPAAASQAEIEFAARRMRIWDDPAQIPATAWDLPFLGPVPRARNDIEQAVARLSEPGSRIDERLFWFNIDVEKLKAARPAEQLSDPCFVHDAALLKLDDARRHDPEMMSIEQWTGTLRVLGKTAGSLEGYRNWFWKIERSGEFEKRASADEVRAALGSLPDQIGTSLAERARDALDRDQFQLCRQTMKTLRAVTGESAYIEHANDVGNRIEDFLVPRCANVQNMIHRGVNWETKNWQIYIPANKRCCQQAAGILAQSIDPLIETLAAIDGSNPISLIGGANPDRRRRVGDPAAKMLRNMGLGWQRCREYKIAGRMFDRAMALTGDPAFLAKLELDQKNLKKQKKGTRTFAGLQIGGGSNWRWAYLAILLISGVIKGLSGESGNSTPRDNPPLYVAPQPYQSPEYTPQNPYRVAPPPYQPAMPRMPTFSPPAGHR